MTAPIRLAFNVEFDEAHDRWTAKAIADPSIRAVDGKATQALTAAFQVAEKRLAKMPYADPKTTETHHLSRIRLGVGNANRRVPSIGWQARIDQYVKGKRVLIASRFYSDRVWGGSGYALGQAIKFRDKYLYLSDLPIREAQRRARQLGIAATPRKKAR
jgi:hypothetical protein